MTKFPHECAKFSAKLSQFIEVRGARNRAAGFCQVADVDLCLTIRSKQKSSDRKRSVIAIRLLSRFSRYVNPYLDRSSSAREPEENCLSFDRPFDFRVILTKTLFARARIPPPPRGEDHTFTHEEILQLFPPVPPFFLPLSQ